MNVTHLSEQPVIAMKQDKFVAAQKVPRQKYGSQVVSWWTLGRRVYELERKLGLSRDSGKLESHCSVGSVEVDWLTRSQTEDRGDVWPFIKGRTDLDIRDTEPAPDQT